MNNSIKKILYVGLFLLIISILIILLWPHKYKISFDTNGGSIIESQIVKKGEHVTKPIDPTKDGYIFKEWQLNNETYDFASAVDKDLVLNAKWDTINKYKISFDTNGGSFVGTQSVSEGKTVTKPADPTKDGYNFVEWQLNGNTYDFNTIVTSDISLVAKWDDSNNNYVVTFDSNGGSNIPSQALIEGEYVTIPEPPIKDGYTFGGWQLNGVYYDFNTEVTTNITLVAEWIENSSVKYVVKFDSNGGSSIASQTITEGGVVKKPVNPTKKGYTFGGWQLNNKNYDFNSKVTANITLIAKWDVLSNYVVTFDSNGGTKISSQMVTSGDKVKIPTTPTKSGYNFIEWQLNGKTYNFNSPVKSNLTLQAKWEPLPKYTVSFNSDGGTKIYSQTVKYGEKASKPTDPTKSGYVFKEWQLNGSTYNFNSTVTKDIELTAVWQKVENVIDAYFLNTQNSTYTTSESIILKTKDNKIILIDTGEKDIKLNNIINKIKSVAGSNTPTIDYLIISHSHTDHAGNLQSILSNNDITIKNIIYKKEKFPEVDVHSIVTNYSSNSNIIETNRLVNDRVSYKINDDVYIILFNLKDVYSNKTNEECNKNYYYVTFESANRGESNLKYNGQYIYLNSLDPDDNTLRFSDTIENVSSNLGLTNGIPNRRYYACIKERTIICNANANSLAVLVRVKTYNGFKYIYIPSDLGNNGYSFFGTNRPDLLNEGFKYSKIYDGGSQYIFENTFDGNFENINNAWSISNNMLVDSNQSNNVRVESESRVANEIRSLLGNNLNNIVIYQETHHGLNNSKDAIDTLEINRKGVYSINLSTSDGKNASTSKTARSYHYTLNNTTILKSGTNDGVYCYIKNNNTYSCSNS